MARSLEEILIFKKTALRYLLARESRLLALGRKPVNKKIANFIKNHEESTVWTSFLDSLNEDLTRNINVFEWKTRQKSGKENTPRLFRLNSESREYLKQHKIHLW